jgi:hypothetical protein
MKELRGTAEASVDAPLATVLSLLEAVDAYPSWYPEVVRRVEVVERDGAGPPSRVRAQLHIAQGPIARDFELLMSVAVQRPSTVRLARVPREPTDPERFEVIWRLNGGERTHISLELLANLDVPRFLPLGGIGDSVARGFADAAVRRLTAAESN